MQTKSEYDMRQTADSAYGTARTSTFTNTTEGYDAAAARMKELNKPLWTKLWKLVTGSLNFYRVHMLYIILTPLIMSGIFYAGNTQYHIDYIDSLFLCVSAMTVTGLATNNLSTLSGFQQAVLFVQMIMGNIIAISMVMILVRQHFFRQEFRHIIEARRQAELEAARHSEGGMQSPLSRLRRFSQSITHNPMVHRQQTAPAPPPPPPDIRLRWGDLFRTSAPPSANNSPRHSIDESRAARSDDSHRSSPSSLDKSQRLARHTENGTPQRPRMPEHQQSMGKAGKKKGKGWKGTKLRTDMIKRVEGGGLGLINPMGWYHSPPDGGEDVMAPRESFELDGPRVMHDSPRALDPIITNADDMATMNHHGMTDQVIPLVESPTELSGVNPVHSRDHHSPLQHPATPEQRRASEPNNHLSINGAAMDEKFPRTKTIAFDENIERDKPQRGSGAGLAGNSNYAYPSYARTTGYMPRTGTIRSMNPGSALQMDRTLTRRTVAGSASGGRILPLSSTMNSAGMPRTMTINQTAKHTGFGGFPTPLALLRAGFDTFFPKQSEKLQRTFTMQRTLSNPGSASNGEVKEVGYISFDAGPYIALNKGYDDILRSQYKYVPAYWFTAFQSVSAFSNTGMSLCDQSMVPFLSAYLLGFAIFFLIFAGNTAFPIFLRCIIWTCYRASPIGSRIRETLQFLLDHPRRCFIYLFPRTQTWFLFLVMVTLTTTDFVCFLVLDIGNPVIEAIPIGQRVAAAFFQSAAVRAAGFGFVPLNSLAPAVKYPIAMSVRSTNVYEEKSLGVFNDDPDEEEPQDQGPEAITKYLGWHARRQLAFDVWWLATALWLVCIIERGQINNEANSSWFSIFNIIFELVSAYGTVGLSLGVGYDNFSLVGAMRPLSKVVFILVMIRGRHRGLPVAIDRAVMLPKDLKQVEEKQFEDETDRLTRRATRRSSLVASSTHPGSPRPLPFDPPTQPTLTHIRSRSNATDIVPPSKRSESAVDDADGPPLRSVTSPGLPERSFSLNRGRKGRSNSAESQNEEPPQSFSGLGIDMPPDDFSLNASPSAEGTHHDASFAPGSSYSARFDAPGAGLDAQGAPRSLGTLKESAFSRHPSMS
ncbi:hypothetical protein QFC21_006818 [Naganishia friedmannii]|uniref:Uncharacterized protein n=1 Tax=Naganishia friedmannii TaxID=89922 RepID=A0ACC2V094_9TREE|nr:hypothetical protein QFC21_006818 [Naganishia friedmannii]